MADINVNSVAVGNRIFHAINESEYTIEEVALELDLSSSHLRRLLKGQYNWRDYYIEFIADLLNMDPDYFKYGKDYVSPHKDDQEFKDKLKEDLEHMETMTPADQLENLAFILAEASKWFKNK